ncbi:MAG: type II secretion system protein [bacterium]|nr:type II secretion system protein [bacterium]
MIQFIRNRILKDERGFTMIEIMVVVAVMGITLMIAIPRFSAFIGQKREDFALFTGMIAKTFDDSFLFDRVNYLTIHLYETSMDSDIDDENEIFSRHNAISVLVREEGKFVDTKRKLLKPREFKESFKIESVILSTGEKVTSGHVMIPYYPQGYSDNAIIHIMVNEDERYSVRIYKHKKEPDVINDQFIEFDN